MTKMMAGMAIDRQNKYEEARDQTHKYCCLVDSSSADIDAKKRNIAQLSTTDLKNLEAHHLDFLKLQNEYLEMRDMLLNDKKLLQMYKCGDLRSSNCERNSPVDQMMAQNSEVSESEKIPMIAVLNARLKDLERISAQFLYVSQDAITYSLINLASSL